MTIDPTPYAVPLQTVVHAFSVLDALQQRPAGVRLVDLSRMVGLHKSTVFRLVRTLVVLGYVAQTEDRRLYVPLLKISPVDGRP